MGPLVLLRHGESTANADDTFAGWLDVPLTAYGVEQARSAGRSLAGLHPHAIHTSLLCRSIDTAHEAARAAGWRTPVRGDWRLNERHYGALQGLNKTAARRLWGEAQVEEWRRSIEVAPPALEPHLLTEQLSGQPQAPLVMSESLGDVAARMTPYWREVLRPELTAGRTVLVVSHGNALRVLLHLATGTPLAETALAQIPTAMPIIPRVLRLEDPLPAA